MPFALPFASCNRLRRSRSLVRPRKFTGAPRNVLDRKQSPSSAAAFAPAASATSPEPAGSGFSFGSFRLEPDGVLYRGHEAIHLPPKELAALRLLLAHAGQIVTLQQLRQALWGDVHVGPESVPRCLSTLRSHLAPDSCIQTIYKRGYRFTLEVRPHGSQPVQALPRLAILPFAAGPSIPEHLGFAVAEETSFRLGSTRNPFLIVLSQDSVFTLARRGLAAQELGQALRADFVLAGSLRMLPAHFRLRAEMIRVADGAQVWVEDFLVARDHITEIELELANRIFLRLGDGSLAISAGAESAAPLEGAAQHREAYDLYQHAHHEWQSLERHRMQDGLQLLLNASELDPSLVAARVDLVNLCVTQSFYGYMSAAVAAETARQAAEPWVSTHGAGRWNRAVFQNFNGRAEAMLPGLGWLCFHVDRDLTAALHAFSLAAHLPHDSMTTRVRVMFELSRHRFPQAIEQLRAAILLDPFSPWLHSRLAWTLHLDGQPEASLECIRNVIAQFPDHEGACMYAAILLAFNGHSVPAIELARDLAHRLPYFDIASAVHAYALACAGQRDEARAILERLQWLSRERFVISAFTPAVYVALGDHDSALAELRASDNARCPWFFQMLADPRLQPLHAHPEFAALRHQLTEMESAVAIAWDPSDA